MPRATDLERAVQAEACGGPYSRMLARCRNSQFLLDDLRECFRYGQIGRGREGAVALKCPDCHTACGWEFWVCPMCYRAYLEARDRPRWFTWKCPDCAKWWCDEFRWCCTQGCGYRRDPDPSIAHREARAERRRNPINVHFDDRNVPPVSGAEVTGVREYRIPPLEIGLMNDPAHRRRLTTAERAALGYSNASGSYISYEHVNGRPYCEVCEVQRPGELILRCYCGK